MANPLKLLAIAAGRLGFVEAAPHAKFTATSTQIPAISLGQTQTMVLACASNQGDSLAAAEDITLVSSGPLPAGVNIAFFYASATNQVTVGFTSSALLALTTTTINWRVTAHR